MAGIFRTLSNVSSGSPRQLAIDNAVHNRGDIAAAIGAVALAIIYVGDRIR